MDRLFLDANVLFSAAYRPDAGVARLWEVSGAVLVTSSYAVEEARRNLHGEDQRRRFDALLKKVEVGEAMMLPPELRGEVDLPEKDWPVLGGAAATGATHLITGDVRHFGRYFGERPLGVLIMKPADYFQGRS
ncbi:MAG: DNA-binding protein [Gemmatimonadetes bacterium]|nr:DNA-binding protein [Gemmatimonadota bacterium]